MHIEQKLHTFIKSNGIRADCILRKYATYTTWYVVFFLVIQLTKPVNKKCEIYILKS